MTEQQVTDTFDDTQSRRRRSSNKPVLEGDLSAITLPDLFAFVSMIRGTGKLILRQIHLEKTVYWNDGEIVFASSNSPDETLGRFLLQTGKITQEQYEESKRRLEPGMRHGKLLIQMGYLSPKDLWWGVKAQVVEILYGLFAWRSGTFHFYESLVDFQEKITLSLSTTSLIMEGIRRMDEGARIKGKIKGPEMIFAKLPGAEPRIEELEDVSEEEMQIWDHIDGRRSIREIGGMSDLTEFEVSRIFFQLVSARLIEEVVAEKSRGPIFLDVEDSPELLRLISTYNGMFEHLFKALTAAVDEENARDIFTTGLQSTDENELWAGVFFDQFGRFDENMLIANISELPFEQRRTVLDEGLNTLLSIQLFEVSQHLDATGKVEVFRYISEQKAQLESSGV
jgi:hypothetical protein